MAWATAPGWTAGRLGGQWVDGDSVGRVVWPERFRLLCPVHRLAHVARLIREFHDAVADFRPPSDAHWQVLVPAEGDEIIAHQDLAPWNLVADDAGGWTFIDCDTAGPGSRLWDLAFAAHGFVPSSANPAFRRADADTRLRVFVDAYGLDEGERRRLVPMLSRRTRSMYEFLRERAVSGVPPWAGLWAEGHGGEWLGDTSYIEEREDSWRAAPLSG